ncbi:hypothetical protein NDU88_001972 [Pleurodeles waltl]|uniref:Uncharacterized protein n=1 Tax=Pleurodeles waltl TaxID=8319 RepID=A0AAV7NCA1_PLEWA|nr:hypothetical protein NDU88_001972 [Pleurodeles waltl]
MEGAALHKAPVPGQLLGDVDKALTSGAARLVFKPGLSYPGTQSELDKSDSVLVSNPCSIKHLPITSVDDNVITGRFQVITQLCKLNQDVPKATGKDGALIRSKGSDEEFLAQKSLRLPGYGLEEEDARDDKGERKAELRRVDNGEKARSGNSGGNKDKRNQDSGDHVDGRSKES